MTDNDLVVEPWQPGDLPDMVRIWNQVVAAGNAFPQEEALDVESAEAFFRTQSATIVAKCDGQVVGLYILHPNNLGRCAHIANASFAVDGCQRGRGIGRALVRDCIAEAGAQGFKGLQFNAVVASNRAARALYESLGFSEVGAIPEGFRNGEGRFEDILIFYIDTPHP